ADRAPGRLLLALQRRRERDRRVGTTRSGRTGEHECMAHAVARGGVTERLAGPHEEVERLALDAVAPGEPSQPVHRVEVEDDGDVGTQVAGGPSGDVL